MMIPAVETTSLPNIYPFPPFFDNKLKSPPAQIKNSGSCRKTKNVQAENHIHHEVADIFRLYGAEYRRTHNLSIEQHNVMYAIEHCRTSAYGFHADICDACGYMESAYNSCRNRHCPKCQGISKRKWVAKRLNELLPAAYHHCVFTLPNRLSLLSLHNRKLIYDLLFDASSQTLLTFGNDPRWLGALIGFYGILHTWSQTLWPHAHTHFIVTAGGLTVDGKWIEPKHKGTFLFPVKALSIVFRGKFIEGLKKAYYAGELVLPDNLKRLDNAGEFERWIDGLVSTNWVVHSKPPFAGPEEVVRYIGRYTHRVAISNHRIISISDGKIRFSYKDNKEKDTNIETIRNFFSSTTPADAQFEESHIEDTNGLACPECGKGRLRSYLVTDKYGRILKLDNSEFIRYKPPDDVS